MSSKLKFSAAGWKNPDLLQNAFVHRSYLNENPEFPFPSNERLEFLGDAVLELVVSNFLYHNFPALPEGEMTALRSALVKTESLAQEARRMELGAQLLLSKGEEESGGRENPYLLANTFEALVGALYLDQGLEKVEEFIQQNLLYRTQSALHAGLKDAKSRFQEFSQAHFGITPTYRVSREWGPPHERRFLCAVYLKRKKVAEGEGKSKQEAEEAAAKSALEESANEDNNHHPLS